MDNHEYAIYGLSFQIEGPKNCSFCTKGNVTKILRHRFPVKNGITELEAWLWEKDRIIKSMFKKGLFYET